LWAGFSLSTVSARSELDRSAHTTAGIGVPATSGQGAAGEQNACVGGDDRGEEDGEGGEHAAQSRCRQKPRRHLHRRNELPDPVRSGDVQRIPAAEVVAGARLGADLEQGSGERGGSSELPRTVIGGDLEVVGNRVRDLGEERVEPQRRYEGLDDG